MNGIRCIIVRQVLLWIIILLFVLLQQRNTIVIMVQCFGIGRYIRLCRHSVLHRQQQQQHPTLQQQQVTHVLFTSFAVHGGDNYYNTMNNNNTRTLLHTTTTTTKTELSMTKMIYDTSTTDSLIRRKNYSSNMYNMNDDDDDDDDDICPKTTIATISHGTNNNNYNELPQFVQVVVSWIQNNFIIIGSNATTTTIQLHCIPVSSMVPTATMAIRLSNITTTTTMNLEEEEDQDQHENHTLYILQFVFPPPPPQYQSKSTNTTTTITTYNQKKNSNDNYNQQNNILLLHLIPSPTTLTTTTNIYSSSLPVGVTRYMTDHSQRVLDIIKSSNSKSIHQQQQGTNIGYDNHNHCSNTTTNNNNSNIQIIHLHEDIWYTKKDIVQSRLKCRLLGNTGIRLIGNKQLQIQQQLQYPRRMYARQTIVRKISVDIGRTFLQLHHLWGCTNTAKYTYGLFLPKTNELIAVATFSSCRKVRRGGSIQQQQQQAPNIYRSYELIRVCCCRDMYIIGGISKLMTAFCNDYIVDDIVTCIDRDWGIGYNNWCKLGFHTVHVMKPIPMVIKINNASSLSNINNNNNENTIHGTNIRRHLIGSGIQYDDNVDDNNNNTATNDTIIQNQNIQRLGLPRKVLEELKSISHYKDTIKCLYNHQYHMIYDTGVERMIYFTKQRYPIDYTILVPPMTNQSTSRENLSTITAAITMSLWNNSHPKYTTTYYSDILGIRAILDHIDSSIDY